MKKCLLILSLICSLTFLPSVSFAKKDTTDVKKQVTSEQIQKTKEQIKAEKQKLKLEKKAKKAELKAKKLAEKTAKEQKKIDEKLLKKDNSAKKAEVTPKVQQKKKNVIKVQETKKQSGDIKSKKTVKTEVKQKADKNLQTQKNSAKNTNLKQEAKKEEPQKKEINVKPVIVVKPIAKENNTNQITKNVKKNDLNVSNKEINVFFSRFADLQNKHSIVSIKKLYTDDFINTDGYNKSQLFDLMKKTFKSYPDITTTYEVKQIIADSAFAMVYVREKIKATTKSESQITRDKGEYSAVLDDIFYLKKIANEWKIYSENVVYENSVLAHGMAKGVKAELSAPQKVLCGQEYSAAVKIDMPEGYSAIASINSTQIVDGYNMSGEKFRQLSQDTSSLERVIKANNDRNNEAVVVSVGFTKITQDIFKKPKVDISGLMILMKRIDVIPANSNYKVAKDKKSVEE